MSPSATPATQKAAASTRARGNQARHQSQPSAIRATPPTQTDDPCRHEPRVRDSRHDSEFSRHCAKQRLGSISFTTAISNKPSCNFYSYNKSSENWNAKNTISGQSIGGSNHSGSFEILVRQSLFFICRNNGDLLRCGFEQKFHSKKWHFFKKNWLLLLFFYKKNIFLNAPIYCLPDIQKSNKTYVIYFKKR